MGRASARPRASAILNADGQPFFFGGTNHAAADSSSQELANFHPRYVSADAAWSPERKKVVTRIHDLARNDGWTSSTLNRYVDQAIGARFSLSYMPDHTALGLDFDAAYEFKLQVETAWNAFAYDPRFFCDAAEKLNWAGLMGLAFRHRMADGEALAIMRFLNRPWFDSRTAVQIISPERLSNPQGAIDSPTRRMGVEINTYGAPIAYWIQNRNPSDVFYGENDFFTWTRVQRRTPWGRAIVVHQFEPEEAGQTRGKSGLATVVKKVFMANKYADTELQAAFVNAVLAAYIESPLDHENLADAFRDPSALGGYTESLLAFHEKNPLTMNGVKIPFMHPGEKINFVNAARPNANYGKFEERVLRYFAAATGQTYEQLAADYSQTNYSSLRGAMLDAWKFLTARRDHFGQHFCSPIFAAWLEDVVDNGIVKLPSGGPHLWEAYAAYTQCAWNGPPRGWVDPLKEVQASVQKMAGGLSSLQKETAEDGGDWRATAQQRAYEKAYYEALGLPDPNNTRATPTAPEQGPTDPDAEDGTDSDEDSGGEPPADQSSEPSGTAHDGRPLRRGRSRIPNVPLAA